MTSCCPPQKTQDTNSCHPVRRFDWLLWGSLAIVSLGISVHFTALQSDGALAQFSASVTEFAGRMWWGVLLGIIFVGIIGKVPREFVITILGKKNGIISILRATMGGVLLDLCSHGILLVGMRLYERGASLGQTMAFLIASPWNSFSLTLILWALIGWQWMLTFLLLSLVIAVISGMLFDFMVKKGVLPDNPNTIDIPQNFDARKEAKTRWKKLKINKEFLLSMAKESMGGSRIVIRWLLFGIVLASLIRTFMPTEHYEAYFGPTMIGLALTLLASTIIEVCSEGSVPIATDLMVRANAPGNSFTFLMAGVSTDYTEIMALKETTTSWKIALFLPLVTLPQIIFLGWLLNMNFTH